MISENQKYCRMDERPEVRDFRVYVGLISCNAPGVGNCNAGGNTTRFNFTTSKFKDNVGRVAVSYKF